MSELRIRMYNVGFGDCFLISLPDDKTILVDCGFHNNAPGSYTGKELVEQIVTDVVALTGEKRIDVVIATHRHRDHVFAFNAPQWDEIDVGEAWFPWVDNPNSAAAAKLWRKNQAFARHLAAAVPSLPIAPDKREEIDFLLWNAGIDERGRDAFGFSAWGNEDALEKLRRRAKKRRYLPRTRKVPETFEPDALPGVTAHVLGPSRNPSEITEGEPPDEQTFKRLALNAGGDNAWLAAPPFGLAWRAPADAERVITRADEERVESIARQADPLFAAEYVDHMINSTSLVLVLDIGKARLLLPGDAEWGTWKRLVADGPRAKACKELFEGATFFKVGHHGSHNATPEDLVENLLGESVPAMISTKSGKGNFRKGIPLPKLLEALGARAVRSDKPPEKLPKGFKRGPGGHYVDLTLRC